MFVQRGVLKQQQVLYRGGTGVVHTTCVQLRLPSVRQSLEAEYAPARRAQRFSPPVCAICQLHPAETAVENAEAIPQAGRKRPRWTVADVAPPEVLAQWHPFLNGTEMPNDFPAGSQRRVWWRCTASECEHVHDWQALVRNRVQRGSGCPYCTGRLCCPCNSIVAKAPHLVRDWDAARNPGKAPEQVSPASALPVWWQCADCGHSWCATTLNRALHGSGCPKCSKSSQAPQRRSSLAMERPDLAAQLHPTLNGGLTARDILVGSSRKVWWLCRETNCVASCAHQWQAMVSNRVYNGAGCPFCSGVRRCACHSLAVQRPDLAKQLHPWLNGELTAAELPVFSGKKVWWLCPASLCEHPHLWQAFVYSRTKHNASCPFCSGTSVCACDSLARRQPALAAQWHPIRNKLRPDQASEFSQKMVWWSCPRGTAGEPHEWQAKITVRAQGFRPCPHCKVAQRQLLAQQPCNKVKSRPSEK